MSISGGLALIQRGAVREQDVAALRPAVEEKLDRRESAHERRASPLRILGVTKLVVLDSHARPLEDLDVEIVARGTQAGEQRARAERVADIQDQIGARAAERELGAAHERRGDA